MIPQQFNRQQLIAMLAWQAEMGADEALTDHPADHISNTLDDNAYAAPASPSPSPSPSQGAAMSGSAPALVAAPPAGSVAGSSAAQTAPHIINQDKINQNNTAQNNWAHKKMLHHIDSLPALSKALAQLDACPLKHTASTMCFADGNAGSRIMIIGEVPGRDEDRLGVPFVGAAGQLLDLMMASIGFDRTALYLVNLLPWRPPGNRTPTDEEMDMLLPYLYRHVQLANPDYILILGGAPAKILIDSSENILKLRGRWHEVDYGDGVMRPTLASLHPAYLMRSPAQKRLAFADLLQLQQRVAIKVDADAS
jgi:uracil-DNA glycosylase family 4